MKGNGEIKRRRKKATKGEGSPGRKPNGDFAKGNTIGKNGRQLGFPNKRTFLRDQVAEAIQVAGGQEKINKLAKLRFMDMLKLQASLEPKDVHVTGQTVQVVNLIMFRETPPKDWKPYEQEDGRNDD